MCMYRVNQNLIVLNLYSVSINKIVVTEFITVKSSIKSKFDVRYVNAEINNLVGSCFQK